MRLAKDMCEKTSVLSKESTLGVMRESGDIQLRSLCAIFHSIVSCFVVSLYIYCILHSV